MSARLIPLGLLVACALVASPPARAAIPAGQLVVNGGGEIGPGSQWAGNREPVPGWSTPDNVQFRAADYLASGDTHAFIHVDDPGASGCRVFYGGDFDSTTSASQLIPVPADAVGVTLKAGARIGGYAGASQKATVTFAYLDSGGGTISSFSFVGDPNDYASATGLFQYADTDTVPAGTVNVRVTIATEGSLNSPSPTYVDDVGMTLDGTDPTIPPAPGCNPATGATGDATNVTRSEATVSGLANPRNEKATAYIQWGSSLAFGLTAAHRQLAGGGETALAETLTGLNEDQTYYYRVVVESDYGTFTGETKSFRTLAPPPPPVGTPTPTVTPTPPGPFAPVLSIEKQRIAKIVSSGFEARLKWSGNNLAKAKFAFYVLKGKKRLKFASWTDASFYAGGSGLTRRPKGKALRYIRRRRSAKILVIWSATTNTGITRSGRKTVTVRR